jgi:hypothetical protein
VLIMPPCGPRMLISRPLRVCSTLKGAHSNRQPNPSMAADAANSPRTFEPGPYWSSTRLL